MKKLLLNFWRFLNSIFLQSFFLSFFLLLAIIPGNWPWNWVVKPYTGEGYFDENWDNRKVSRYIPTDVDVTAGFDGGALAMGLITCMCIFSIICFEINKTKP